jgi:hypothetical protein
MTNPVRTGALGSADISDKAATTGTDRAVAEGRAKARQGADLLGHLPAERFSRGMPSSLSEASYALANEQLDRLSRACAVLQTGRDASTSPAPWSLFPPPRRSPGPISGTMPAQWRLASPTATARFIWPVPLVCGISPSCISGCITSIACWQVPRSPLILPARCLPSGYRSID